MPLQRSSQHAVGGLPQARAAIIAATGQLRPIRTPRDTTNPGWLRPTNPPTGTGVHLPHLHPLLIARTVALCAIRTARHAIEEDAEVTRVWQDLPSLSTAGGQRPNATD